MPIHLPGPYHCDPNAFSVGELPERAYFIPFESEDASRHSREHSAFFHLLDGNWKFHYEPSLYDMDDFYKDGYDDSGFEWITVPECWQLHGADRIQYQTSPYTIPFDVPHVPKKNPSAAYVKEFSWQRSDKRCELHFEGKDSCIYVWLNGAFVGYGEVPHSESVFDVTDALKNGSNRLCVLVMKWCSGTYLDDQDKIRLSGLFRDVYLLERAPDGLRDFFIETKLSGEITLRCDAGDRVFAKICDGDSLLAYGEAAGKANFLIAQPKLWSAEEPHLYELVLHCAGEVIRHRFGIREVCVEDCVFKINQTPVKLYGVNRHDTDPRTGYVTSTDHIRNELILMKQHNINAIRTAHYPNDPRFYAMCDELGFYVMSEADMECHGCHYVEGFASIVDAPMFAPAIHNRVRRMLEAYKNHTSIVIWSLGNESGWGKNLLSEAQYLKAADPTRPIHYEGVNPFYKACQDNEKAVIDSALDFYSVMYPTFGAIREYLANDIRSRPLLMCEYCHAMGNSAGDLRFYDELIGADARFAGGFVWEWCDHSILQTDEAGTAYFAYGGQFGEKHHLHNFCMDGVVNPDREPHSALLEMKAVFSPLRITRTESGSIRILNRNAFKNLSDYSISWEISLDRRILERSCVTLAAAPGESVTLDVPTAEPYAGRHALLTVSILTRDACAWAPGGHVISRASFPLAVLPEALPQCCAPHLSDDGCAFIVTGDRFSVRFRHDEAVPGSITADGRELLSSPMEFCCCRAPTDNDIGRTFTSPAMLWKKTTPFGRIEYPTLTVHNFTAEVFADHVLLLGDFMLSVQGRLPISRGRIEYRVFGDGRLSITQTGSLNEKLPYWLPRYGYIFHLAELPEEIDYFGCGPAECYEDKCMSGSLGWYRYIPDEPRGAYEKPQESGSHTGTREITLTGGSRKLRITGDSFSFCASRHSVHRIAEAANRKDLSPDAGLYLHIDYRMSGVGSHSCGGQDPVPECRLNPGEAFRFEITLSLQ